MSATTADGGPAYRGEGEIGPKAVAKIDPKGAVKSGPKVINGEELDKEQEDVDEEESIDEVAMVEVLDPELVHVGNGTRVVAPMLQGHACACKCMHARVWAHLGVCKSACAYMCMHVIVLVFVCMHACV